MNYVRSSLFLAAAVLVARRHDAAQGPPPQPAPLRHHDRHARGPMRISTRS